MEKCYDGRIAEFLERLIDKGTGFVKPRTLVELHELLTRNGCHLAWKEEYGPKGGWQLFYHGGGFRGAGKGLVIRVKTHGEQPGKHRAFKPHLSVTWQEGMSDLGEEWKDFDEHEKGKYNAHGELEGKTPPSSSDADAWANRTHPYFRGFEGSSAENPMGLYGAESLPLSGGSV